MILILILLYQKNRTMIRIDNKDYIKVMEDFHNSKVSMISYDETLHRSVIRLFSETNKMFLFIILLGVFKMKGCFSWNESNLVYNRPKEGEYFACLRDNKNNFEIFFDGGIFMIKGNKSKLSLKDFDSP